MRQAGQREFVRGCLKPHHCSPLWTPALTLTRGVARPPCRPRNSSPPPPPVTDGHPPAAVPCSPEDGRPNEGWGLPLIPTPTSCSSPPRSSSVPPCACGSDPASFAFLCPPPSAPRPVPRNLQRPCEEGAHAERHRGNGTKSFSVQSSGHAGRWLCARAVGEKQGNQLSARACPHLK